jgi:hypothetical protein
MRSFVAELITLRLKAAATPLVGFDNVNCLYVECYLREAVSLQI